MVRIVKKPMVIKAAGSVPKKIDEFVGRVASGTKELSIARMKSPSGWKEPGQQPEFDEYTVVLNGMLRIATREKVYDVHSNQAVIVPAGEWVQYSTPTEEGAEYIAVCLPAFTPETVHRDR